MEQVKEKKTIKEKEQEQRKEEKHEEKQEKQEQGQQQQEKQARSMLETYLLRETSRDYFIQVFGVDSKVLIVMIHFERVWFYSNRRIEFNPLLKTKPLTREDSMTLANAGVGSFPEVVSLSDKIKDLVSLAAETSKRFNEFAARFTTYFKLLEKIIMCMSVTRPADLLKIIQQRKELSLEKHSTISREAYELLLFYFDLHDKSVLSFFFFFFFLFFFFFFSFFLTFLFF